MNAHAQTIEASETALITAEPARALSSRDVFLKFKSELEAEILAHVPDLSTDKGRKALASLAFRVGKLKNAIDDAAKKRLDEMKDDRGFIWDELELLQKRARQPLTDWEEAEKQRQATIADIRSRIQALSIVRAGSSAEMIGSNLSAVQSIELDPDVFRSEWPAVVDLKTAAITGLTATLEITRRHEADQAELARLRAAEAKRAEDARLAAAGPQPDPAPLPVSVAIEASEVPRQNYRLTRQAAPGPQATTVDLRDASIATAASAIMQAGRIPAIAARAISQAIADGKIPGVSMIAGGSNA